ncbi:MAG: Flp pilus assembly complex ATPase component TadA [Candidatus Omnitrophica bacterium]|nr:Flp pilus assembly complex ATPase component TadA [Candidatus Omnitrophota bacterium]
MSTVKERIKEILLREKILKPEDLERALEEQRTFGGHLSKILVRMGLIDEEQLTFMLSEELQLPIINVSRIKLDPAVVSLIPMDVLKKYQIVPVSRIGGNIALAMADPLNILVMDNVKALTGFNITPVISRPKDIRDALEQQGAPKAHDSFEKIKKDIKEAEDLELVSDTADRMNTSQIEHLTQEAPIIRLTTTIIRQAVVAKASDVFIEPMEKYLRIRYRVDGVLREIDRMTKALHFPIVSRIKVVSNLDISEHRLPQDGRFKTILDGGKEVDFRVSVLPTAHGEKIVLRVLDKNLDRVDIEKVGFEPGPLARLKECCLRPHGMVLACGPTGSGKTTTLYSILRFIDSPGKNIVTVEDPVEYQMKGLNQVNIRFEVGLTFTATLRSILRQDPDVIMIGEVRDSETLDIAVKAALTGHLVLTSLHTTTAAGSIVRMINMGIEPFLICSAVNGIVAQRLLRRICPSCRQEIKITQTLYDKLGIGLSFPGKDLTYYRGKGCTQCGGTGYSGRVGINEVLPITTAVRKLILSKVGEIDIKVQARLEGMQTMREDALIKAAKGLTTLEEVVRVTAADEAPRFKEVKEGPLA